MHLFVILPDQTPTPTRFLQNCEEVGLFKEIEEEFLQAQEEEKSKQVLFFFLLKCKSSVRLVLVESFKGHLSVRKIKAQDPIRKPQISDLLRGKTHQESHTRHIFPVN